MGRGRNYTISERAIITIGVLSGLSLDDINKILASEQNRFGSYMVARELNEKSYKMLKDTYLPKLTNNKDLEKEFINLLHHILNPKPLSEYKND